MTDSATAITMILATFGSGTLLAVALCAFHDWRKSRTVWDFVRICVNLSCAIMLLFVGLEAILVDSAKQVTS